MEDKKKGQSYKVRNTLSDNNRLQEIMGSILKFWRQEQQKEDGHEVTVNDIAKTLGERFEKVYRVENGGGTTAVLIKYIMYIKKLDPKFDFLKELEERIKIEEKFNHRPMKTMSFLR